MKILLYNPDNGVTRNFMPHLWMFLLQELTPPGHEVILIDGNAKAMTDDEMKQAAEYFSSVRWRPHVRVVETKLVPKTQIQGELFIPTGEEGAVEPIGNRIIEVPTDVEQNQVLRNSRGTWIAYVPVGSIKKGQGLIVHTHDCHAIRKSRRSEPDKWIDVEWDPERGRLFEVRITVHAQNRRGVLAKVAAAISDAGSNIENVSMDDERGIYTSLFFNVQVSDRIHLARVIHSIRRIPEVVRINRVKTDA